MAFAQLLTSARASVQISIRTSLSDPAMTTTYKAAFTPRRTTARRSSSGASTARRYNDPNKNYDDPSFPLPKFVSRLQPISFTSSLAPRGVAACPVPLLYDPVQLAQAAQTARSNGSQSARFSTTSLESRLQADAGTIDDARRFGMSGVEAFRFALRQETGAFTGRAAARHEAHLLQPQESHRSVLHPAVSAKLPLSAFHYHVNHTNSMTRENARQRRFRSPLNPSIVVTSTVWPRAEAVDRFAPPNVMARSTELFPVAYNPGHIASSAREHAFDTRTKAQGQHAKMAEPMYDSFPLHPPEQQRFFQPAPNAQPLQFDATINRYRPVEVYERTTNGQA
jgi:hypothetical protein